MPTTKTPLRYPGGKSSLYPLVKDILFESSLGGCNYVEPFAGGAGLALKLLLSGDVDTIHLNDIDPAIYAFWHSVLYRTEELCQLISHAILDVEEWRRQQRIVQKRDASDLLVLGFATFYANRTSVSGILHGGLIGGIRQSGKYKMSARYNPRTAVEKITKIAEYRDRIKVTNEDAVCIISASMSAPEKTFYNIDPPYVGRGQDLYTNSFREADHRALCQVITTCPSPWIVTYDDDPLVRELYSEYRCVNPRIYYSIGRRRHERELMYFSENCQLPARTEG